MIEKIKHILIPSPKIPVQSPRQARITLKQLPEPTRDKPADKPLSSRKLSKLEIIITYFDRFVLRPLNIFQGSISAMTKTEVVSNTSVELEATKMWNEFDDPNAAYVLLFRNTIGFGKGSEHAAVVLGATKGKRLSDVSGYASWGFDKDHKTVGPFVAPHVVHTFLADYREHGRPVVIKIPSMHVKNMKDKWQWIQNHNKFYRLIGMNCSTVGYRLIKNGLGLAGRKKDHHVKPKGFWTPLDLLAYAKSVQQGKTHSSAT